MKGEQLTFEFRENNIVFIMKKLNIPSCDYFLVKDPICRLLKYYSVKWIVESVTATHDQGEYRFRIVPDF